MSCMVRVRRYGGVGGADRRTLDGGNSRHHSVPSTRAALAQTREAAREIDWDELSQLMMDGVWYPSICFTVENP